MWLKSNKILWSSVFIFAINCIVVLSHRHHKRKYVADVKHGQGPEFRNKARTNILHGSGFIARHGKFVKGANFKRNLKRQNVTGEKETQLLVRKAEDILLDEIRGSDQAADQAEATFNIPQENEYFNKETKSKDPTDLDTSTMIEYNEKKGVYLPVPATEAKNGAFAHGLALDDEKAYTSISGTEEEKGTFSPLPTRDETKSTLQGMSEETGTLSPIPTQQDDKKISAPTKDKYEGTLSPLQTMDDTKVYPSAQTKEEGTLSPLDDKKLSPSVQAKEEGTLSPLDDIKLSPSVQAKEEGTLSSFDDKKLSPSVQAKEEGTLSPMDGKKLSPSIQAKEQGTLSPSPTKDDKKISPSVQSQGYETTSPFDSTEEKPQETDGSDQRKSKLTEQFENISGLPEFMQQHKERDNTNVSLVRTIADALQPSVSAFTGIKQLMDETKVEQSLKKGLDDIPNIEHSIAPDYRNLPVPLDKTAINSMPFSQGAPLSTGYSTPISQDQVFDEAVSPPEQLLDELSAGRFRHPLSDTALTKMSNWNANKEYLVDNGYLSPQVPASNTHISRISTDILPAVHDVFLNRKPSPPTEGISKEIMNYIGRDPEVLGRNQEFLNSNQFHSMSDLDSIGPPVYPARVLRLPHHHPTRLLLPRPTHLASPPTTRVFMPPKHVFTHMKGPNMFEDVDEGAEHHWHAHRGRHHSHHYDDDEEGYLPSPKVRSARCSYKPCLNGGRCTALIDRYICTCREGFTGINCEKRSLCYPNPCRHGTCSSNPENFVCTCEVGWQGKRCEERDKCHPSPCIHGGTCSSTGSGVYCSCPPGFRGRYCETEAKCSPVNPCLNGGRCQEMPFTYMCICKNAYSGRNCEVVLNPTVIPPTVPFKPVPPQAIPIPHDQPPFLLDELNSLNNGPLQEHPVPVMKFDSATVPLDIQHSGDGHHHMHTAYSIPDFYHDEHYNEDRPRPVSSNPALIIHTGDPTKEASTPKKEDSKSAKKKRPPTDLTQDDRYQTHLVSAGLIKGKPANEEENQKNPEHKKPPIETAEQVKAKPTEKEDNKPKQLVPTSELLKKLQNPHPVEDHIYVDNPKQLFSKEVGSLFRSDSLSVRPMVKNKVLKAKPKNKAVSPVKQKGTKLGSLPTKPDQPVKGSKNHQTKEKHPGRITAEIMCPNFCNEFCDKWCTDVGCCKKTEVKGPTTASNLPYEKYHAKESKGTNKCLMCSDNADCYDGRCRCKKGFVGNGRHCEVDPCVLCHEQATCKSRSCVCNVGYFGNGYTCTKFTDHCGRCSPNADCISSFCLCKPGYYGNGNDCWPIVEPML